ncbi:hypothetical protein evm_000311 [Chilo suppressalis]|nr:hypothetical protein evm_000311 [Chilo suppressalis]
MTGEGGYYFTNLCCAVSFIENLTAESLNMDKKEFDCYMSMPASIGGSAWAAALSLCGASREAEEQREAAQRLLQDARNMSERAAALHADAVCFQEQIAKKVEDVLAKTPLEIKPRRELPRLCKSKTAIVTPLIDLELNPTPAEPQTAITEESRPLVSYTVPSEDNSQSSQPTIADPVPNVEKDSITDRINNTNTVQPASSIHELEHTNTAKQGTQETEPKLNILGFEVIEKPSPPKSPQNLDQTWQLKQTSSLELLTPSPLGFTPFDSRSIDELMTPDEFGSDSLAPGLSNINYDIDLSDFSGDNSVAEDPPKEAKDPFSPEGLKKAFDPFAPQPTASTFKEVLDKFDEFSLTDNKTNRTFDPFDVIHRNDPFSPERKEGSSILDDSDSPTTACLLPSPLQPQSSNKP